MALLQALYVVKNHRELVIHLSIILASFSGGKLFIMVEFFMSHAVDATFIG